MGAGSETPHPAHPPNTEPFVTPLVKADGPAEEGTLSL